VYELWPYSEVQPAKCLGSRHSGNASFPAKIVRHPMCRAHAAKVRSIWWAPDDTTLLTCGADGAVFQWRVAGLARLKEFALQARGPKP
jgi:WD40 repeat protein